MAFEKYIQSRLRRSTVPMVTINTHSQLYFNIAAVRGLGVDKCKVTLHFDRGERIIGIAPSNSEEYSLHSIHRSTTGSLFITCKGFLEWAGVDTTTKRNYPIRWSDDKTMLLIPLGECKE
jgi:hypothetical protein